MKGKIQKILVHQDITMVAIGDLIANPDNPKKHNRRQIRALMSLMRRSGFLVPLLITRAKMIVAGHGRVEAAKLLGMTEVPCIDVGNLTEEEIRIIMVGENRMSELSTYDEPKLNDHLLALFESDFELETVGYSVDDVDFNVEVVRDDEEEELFPLPPATETAITQLGDLWIIGDQKLLCADARQLENWYILLDGKKARLIFSDLPYNVPIQGHVSTNGTQREFVMGAGELSSPEFVAFMRAIFRNLVQFSLPGSIHLHCMDWRHMREMLDATDGLYSEFKQLLVWKKTNAGMGSFYRSQHELIFAFKNGRAKHVNNFKLGESGRYRTNVIEYAGANTFRKGRDEDLAAHSTVKPTAMVMDFILDCSHKGDLVLDPTVGSGTTLIAAHRTKRSGAGMELDPLYCDVAIQRVSEAVGQPAILAGDGRTFEAIKAERLGQDADQ